MMIKLKSLKTKIMNRIIVTGLCAVVLLAFSCGRDCEFDLVKPADIKPIDWEGYNDVYTVFWNILTDDCHGAGTLTGDIIKIYGKLDISERYGGSFFSLIYEQEYDENNLYDFVHKKYDYPAAPSIHVSCLVGDDELQEKLASCDLTRRCYIKGEFAIGALTSDRPGDYCCFSVPKIYLKNINDKYSL
jgi:hypothetical protein